MSRATTIRPLERVLERLESTKETASGWQARCPAHDDRNPSLSISEARNGTVLLNCHAGCNFNEIVDALGLTPADLYPSSGTNGSEIVATYPYTDEHGEVLFEVVRKEGKQFRQRRPDGSGGWIWNLKGTRRVLYNLPAVLEAARAGDTVYVVEGEKDVATLERWGFTATCNSAGAGSWKEEYSQALKGADVVILPDNDEEGREHAREVARSVLPGVASVKIVELPDLDEKGDVSDWASAGGTAEKLQEIILAIEPLQRPPGEGHPRQNARNGTSATLATSEPPAQSDPLALEDAPSIPDDAFENLPAPLGEATSFFDQRHERDVMLTGGLGVLSGCLPNVGGHYGHAAPRLLRPDLNVAVVAPAAAGKGPLHWAGRLGQDVDRFLRRESERVRQRWEQEREYREEAGEPFDAPKPPKRSLYLPANTSAAAFHEGLFDRQGRAVVFETEIDSLTNALGQEWGQFDDTLRKCFHHETASYNRKSEGEVVIEDPRLSVVLSGTPAQFSKLVGSAESGLYSRFALYYFRSAPRWISQRPTADALRRVERFEEMAESVRRLFEVLGERDEVLRFFLTDEQWQRHTATFAPMLRKAFIKGVAHLSSVIKRAGVVAFRTAMILTVLRVFEDGVDLRSIDSLEATDDDVGTGLTLACVYCDHALRFGKARLERGEMPDPRDRRIATMLREMDERFMAGDYYALSEQLGVCERTLFDDLQAAEEGGLIEPLHGNGLYRQVGVSAAASDAADVADDGLRASERGCNGERSPKELPF